MLQAANSKFDSWDLTILRMLQEDATTSIEAIMDRLGMQAASASAQLSGQIEARLRKLEQQKILMGRVAILDAHALGLFTLVFTSVRLMTHSREALAAFEEGVQRCPQIVECFSIMEEDDYVLKIILRTPAEYDRFLKQQLLSFSPLAEVHSTVVVATVKAVTRLPI